MCELTVVADHLFYEEIGEGNLEKTVMQMLWHVKEANAVFQSKVWPFLDDGIRAAIKFQLTSWLRSKISDRILLCTTGSILSKDVHFIARNPYKNYSFNKAMNYLVIKHLVKQYFMKKRVSVTCAH